VAVSILFIYIQILTPAIAYRRAWSPTTLFATAMLGYAICGCAGLLETKFAFGIATSTEQAFRDSYHVWSRAHLWLNLGLVMALLAAISWLQTRFGAMLYPGITKVLFWLFHFSLIANFLYPTVLAFFLPDPQRYFLYPSWMQLHQEIGRWASFGSYIAIIGLLALLVWSIVLTRQRRRKDEP